MLVQKRVTFFAIVAFWAATTPLATADVFKEELVGQVLPLEIHNQCNHPIRVVLMFERYRPGMWGVSVEDEDGWWHVEPGVRTGLNGSDGRVVFIKPYLYSRLFAYAESTDGSNLVWSGNPAIGKTTNNRADAMRLSNGEEIPYFEVGGSGFDRWKTDNVVRLSCR